MKKQDKILVGLFIIILALALYYSTPHGEKTTTNTQQVHTITSINWFPPQITTTPSEIQTTYYQTETTTQTMYVEAPYSAAEIIFTIYDLENLKTITGTAYYNYAAIITSFTANAGEKATKDFIVIMNAIGRRQVLTIDDSGYATNDSIKMSDTLITFRTTNTLAVITLVNPAYTTISFTDSSFTIDLGWLAPNTIHQTTQHFPVLPIVEGFTPAAIYNNGVFTIYSPQKMNGEIVSIYNSSTYMEINIFRDRIMINTNYLTFTNGTAYNSTTTMPVTFITEQPPYTNLPSGPYTTTGTIVYYSNDGIFIEFNTTAIYFSYTTTVNSIPFTVTGWFIWMSDAKIYTTVSI